MRGVLTKKRHSLPAIASFTAQRAVEVGLRLAGVLGRRAQRRGQRAHVGQRRLLRVEHA